MNNSGGIGFGSLHNSHAIHCESRDDTWKAYFLCAVDGVCHHTEKSWGGGGVECRSHWAKPVQRVPGHHMNRISVNYLCNFFGVGLVIWIDLMLGE